MTGMDNASANRLWLNNRPADPGPATIAVQGSKNCFNHMLVVGMLGDDEHELSLGNAPEISDRQTTQTILRTLGLDVEVRRDQVRVAGRIQRPDLPADDVRRLRVSMCYGVAAAAVTRSCFIPLPGGDAFTRRPVDLHLRVLHAAGAAVSELDDGVQVDFARSPHAFESEITGPYGPSMGASVSALAVAAVARGTSTIHGVSPEPEVEQVKLALLDAGIRIEEVGPGSCRVEGAAGLLSGSVACTVPGDRMEAATYIFLAAARRKALRLDGLRPGDLPAGLHDTLTAIGIPVGDAGDGLVVPPVESLRPVDVTTAPHPGYPTDAQPQLAALLSFTDGTSRIAETIYPARTTHVGELTKLNLDIDVRGRDQIIRGGQNPVAGVASVRDIRCGAALMVAAARAGGVTELRDPSRHLWRGYAGLTQKLGALDMHAEWAA